MLLRDELLPELMLLPPREDDRLDPLLPREVLLPDELTLPLYLSSDPMLTLPREEEPLLILPPREMLLPALLPRDELKLEPLLR